MLALLTVSHQCFVVQEEAPLPEGITCGYLVEPLRRAEETVKKFSGTTQAGANQGLMGATADALAHFSHIASKGQMVLSDLQAMKQPGGIRDSSGLYPYILFDPMVHSCVFIAASCALTI